MGILLLTPAALTIILQGHTNNFGMDGYRSAHFNLATSEPVIAKTYIKIQQDSYFHYTQPVSEPSEFMMEIRSASVGYVFTDHFPALAVPVCEDNDRGRFMIEIRTAYWYQSYIRKRVFQF